MRGPDDGVIMIVNSEEKRDHHRIQKLALGIPESRAYWHHIDPDASSASTSLQAFAERWYGPTTLARVRRLTAQMRARYNCFPNALAVLRTWNGMGVDTRRCICHWHLQLTDPMYRTFTGDLLVERRSASAPRIDRPAVIRWVRARGQGRWAETTVVQFGSKLLSAAAEAGLVSGGRDPRQLRFPRIPDDALAYLLYLLREVRFEGTLADNPYLRSVGLDGFALDERLNRLPGLKHIRLGTVHEMAWDQPTISAWASEAL